MRQTVDQLQLRIRALEQHKAALVTGSDKEICQGQTAGSRSGRGRRARQS